MTYCAYCGAKMRETADVCPACGKWKRQVELPGGKATVAGPKESEKTKTFSGAELYAPAQQASPIGASAEGAAPARQSAPAPAQPPVRNIQPKAPPTVSPARRQNDTGYAQPQPAAQPRQTQPRQTQPRPAQTRQTQPRPAQPRQTQRRERARPRKKTSGAFLPLLIGGGAILAAVIVTLVLVFTRSGPRGIANKLADAYEAGNVDDMLYLCSDLMRAQYDDDDLEELFESSLEAVNEDFENRLGEDYKISTKVTVHGHYTGKELKRRLQTTFENLEDYDFSAISEMTLVNLTLTAKNDRGIAMRRIDLTVVKENGSWRLASHSLE